MSFIASNATWFLQDAANCTVLVLGHSARRRWFDTRDGDGEILTWEALGAAAITRCREEDLDASAALLVLCFH